jgi:hypothetical protein
MKTTNYQVIYEDPADGWIPTNLGIFTDPEEAKQTARHWKTGYKTRGQGEPRMAIQAIEPRPLPAGATLI